MGKLKQLFESSYGNNIVVKGIKYIPILSTILLTVHVGFLLLGIEEIYTEWLSVLLLVLLVLLMVLLSVRFNFCVLHKLLILYMTIMTCCVCVQRLDGFGDALNSFRIVLFAIGAALSGIAIYKINEDGCGEQ